ncbi:MAG: hypothetical protein WBB19_06380 [Desulforhopalus sp.]
MSLADFLAQFGFDDNPFRSTNAADEPKLTEYFVPPPYFASVLGTPAHPRSDVVLAPRGGGKTAQRIKIESESTHSNDFLCVSYEKFDIREGFKASDADLPYHLNNICRLLLVAALSEIESNPAKVSNLNTHKKTVLKYQVQKFLGGLSSADYESAINSLKNIGDKANDLWSKYGGKVAALINAFIAKYEFGTIDISGVAEVNLLEDDSLRYHFQELLKILSSIGFSSIYILVDRVDELYLTAKDAQSTFNFIKPLLEDLPTLETPNVAFKFFLWDQIENFYKASGARPDRVPVHKLGWSPEELSRMLTERLRAYSDGNITSFNDLLESNNDIDAHKLIAYFSYGSPRDMIRVCQTIINEQTRMDTSSPSIKEQSLWMALKNFSDVRSDELFGSFLPDLRKIGAVTFTINGIANDIFRISQQAARAKVQKWMNVGSVAKIGELPNPGNRPLHLFGLLDPRLAVALRPGQETELILGNYVLTCPSCGKLCVSDRAQITCDTCFDSFVLANTRSILEICSF